MKCTGTPSAQGSSPASMNGADTLPFVAEGLSQAQIASQLRNPASPVAKVIDGSANVIIAAIINVLHHQASG